MCKTPWVFAFGKSSINGGLQDGKPPENGANLSGMNPVISIKPIVAGSMLLQGMLSFFQSVH